MTVQCVSHSGVSYCSFRHCRCTFQSCQRDVIVGSARHMLCDLSQLCCILGSRETKQYRCWTDWMNVVGGRKKLQDEGK